MFSQSEGEDVWLERGGTYQAQGNIYFNRTSDTSWVNNCMTIKSFTQSLDLGNPTEIGSRK